MSCCNVVVTVPSDETIDDSEMFHFEQKLTDFVRAEKISFSNVCLTLASMFMIYLVGVFFGFSGAEIFIFLVVGGVLFMAFGGNKKIFLKNPKNLNEKWEISLEGTRLSWVSPPSMVRKSNELSFTINIEDIRKVQQSYSPSAETAPYTFFMNDGSKINPGMYSSVNMKELIRRIQLHDILFEYVAEFD